MVVPLGHNVDEEPIQVPIILITYWINYEVPHELVLHSNGSILVWKRGIYDFLLNLKLSFIYVTTNQLQM